MSEPSSRDSLASWDPTGQAFCADFSVGGGLGPRVSEGALSMDQGSVRVTLQQEFRTKADGAFAQIKKTLHFFSTEKKNCSA